MQLPMGITRGVTNSGLAFLDVEHPKARARIFLQGAHITAFQAADRPPLLWLSSEEAFLPNVAIRGGIPICWPWFGAHPSDPSAPAHGFARTSEWSVEDVVSAESGVTITLTLVAQPRPYWPHQAHLKLVVSMSNDLNLALTTHNVGQGELILTQALHTYFDIVDISRVQVTGLRRSRYDDQLLGVLGVGLECPEDELGIAEEIDRVYYPRHPIGVRAPSCDLEINTGGSASAVIWNPWVEKSARLSRFPDNGYRSMLCVETANCGADVVALAAGDSHTLQVEYRQLNTGKN